MFKDTPDPLFKDSQLKKPLEQPNFNIPRPGKKATSASIDRSIAPSAQESDPNKQEEDYREDSGLE